MKIKDGIKRFSAKRKAGLVMEIIQSKTTTTKTSRSFDISPSEIEDVVDEAK